MRIKLVNTLKWYIFALFFLDAYTLFVCIPYKWYYYVIIPLTIGMVYAVYDFESLIMILALKVTFSYSYFVALIFVL